MVVVFAPVVVDTVDEDEEDVVVVESSSVVVDVVSDDGVVEDDEGKVDVVEVGLDPDDVEVVDAPPVVVVDAVCDNVVVGRLVVGLDVRRTDVVVVVDGVGIDVPLLRRREERTAPEALVVDPERSSFSMELTGKSPWSAASTPDCDPPTPSSNRLRLPDEPESARPLDPTGSASSAEPADTTPPAGSAVWSSEPSTTARTTATMITPETSKATVDRMARTPTAKRRSPGSAEPTGLGRMDAVAVDSSLDTEGSVVGVATEGSAGGAGTEGSGVGVATEGSVVGAGTEGPAGGVATEGSGESSSTTSVLFDSGPIGIGRGAGRLRSSSSNSVVSTASRGENGDGLVPDIDAPACR